MDENEKLEDFNLDDIMKEFKDGDTTEKLPATEEPAAEETPAAEEPAAEETGVPEETVRIDRIPEATVSEDATIKIPLDELVDKEAERARLTKEADTVEKQLQAALAKLNNKAFVDKAPANVVAGARENAERLQEKLSLLKQSLQAL